MIEKELFERLQQQYSSIISNIIKSDVRFYRTNQTIQWRFGYDERVAIFAWCDRKTNIVTVNIAAVDFSFQQNEPLHIEYFLLHEIRHIYQHLEIEDYRKDPTKCNNAELAKKWSEEENNYVTALNKEGKENRGYFMQDMEMDAFAYAYAVMMYKYGEVKYLYVPKAYQNNEFDRIVNEWQVSFKNEGAVNGNESVAISYVIAKVVEKALFSVLFSHISVLQRLERADRKHKNANGKCFRS